MSSSTSYVNKPKRVAKNVYFDTTKDQALLEYIKVHKKPFSALCRELLGDFFGLSKTSAPQSVRETDLFLLEILSLQSHQELVEKRILHKIEQGFDGDCFILKARLVYKVSVVAMFDYKIDKKTAQSQHSLTWLGTFAHFNDVEFQTKKSLIRLQDSLVQYALSQFVVTVSDD